MPSPDAPHDEQLLSEIEEAALLLLLLFAAKMREQGEAALRRALELERLTAAHAVVLVPDSFGVALFTTAEPTIDALARVAVNHAVNTLPPGFTGVVPETAIRRIIEETLDETARHLKGVNEVTRDRVRQIIIRGIAEQRPITEIAAEIEMVVGDLITQDGRLISANSRSKTIARTETAWASGATEAGVWRESGIAQVLIFDGPECGWWTHNDPEKADGLVVTLQRYRDRIIAHPNCVRMASPLDDGPRAVQASARARLARAKLAALEHLWHDHPAH